MIQICLANIQYIVHPHKQDKFHKINGYNFINTLETNTLTVRKVIIRAFTKDNLGMVATNQNLNPHTSQH